MMMKQQAAAALQRRGQASGERPKITLFRSVNTTRVAKPTDVARSKHRDTYNRTEIRCIGAALTRLSQVATLLCCYRPLQQQVATHFRESTHNINIGISTERSGGAVVDIPYAQGDMRKNIFFFSTSKQQTRQKQKKQSPAVL